LLKEEFLRSAKIRKPSDNKKKVVKLDIQKEIGKIIVKLKNPSDRLITRTKKRKTTEAFYDNQLLANQKFSFRSIRYDGHKNDFRADHLMSDFWPTKAVLRMRVEIFV
jgi:hypothetical protein